MIEAQPEDSSQVDVQDSASSVSRDDYGDEPMRASGSIVSSSTNTTSTSSSSLSSNSAHGFQSVRQKMQAFAMTWCTLSAKPTFILAWPALIVQSIQLLSFLLDPSFDWGEGVKPFLQAVSFLRTFNVNYNFRNPSLLQTLK